MKKCSIMLGVSIVLALIGICGGALAQQAPVNVTGSWTIYSTDIDDGATVVKHLEIAQDGNEISGYFEGPNQSGPINGEVDGHHIHFVTVTKDVLNFHGDVVGNTITGNYGLHGQHAQWQAQREPENGAPEQAPVAEQMSAQPELNAQATEPAPTEQLASASDDSSDADATPAPAAPLTPDQLDALVAPIALYPDALVAQVLASAESPSDVTAAQDWLTQNESLTGDALSQAVAQQPWDQSVKSLTQFPSVLANMATNVSWTTQLGQAYATQQPEVMTAVQTMRARAQAAGTLQSNSQISVMQQSPSTIVIQTANPQVVYVPQYNPAVVYGAAVVLPSYYVPPPVPVASVGLYFGTGVAVAASVGVNVGWGGGWGWHAWGLNWGGGGGGTVIYNNNTYINNNNHWGPRRYPPYDPNYHPGHNTNYGPHGHYHHDGYYGPNGHFHPYAPGARGVPNGGANGNRGLIGGNGGTQHLQPGQVQRQDNAQPHSGDASRNPGFDPGHANESHPDASGARGVPNGGANGNRGLIGGNGGTQHLQPGQVQRQDNAQSHSDDAGRNPDFDREHASEKQQRGDSPERHERSGEHGHAQKAHPQHPHAQHAHPQHEHKEDHEHH